MRRAYFSGAITQRYQSFVFLKLYTVIELLP